MDARVDDFDVLHRRLHLSGILTTRTACHFGGGSDDSEVVNKPVIKTAHGEPYIPGSSLKGVVRSTLEGLLHGVENVRGKKHPTLWSCNIFTDNCGKQTNRNDPLRQHCAVCSLLGSQLVASHVRFSDARLIDTEDSVVEARDGVAIDRDTRIAANKHKYDLETITPGAQFAITLFIHNPQDWSLGLLLYALDAINDGFVTLGGSGSRGLGGVSLQWENVMEETAQSLLAGQEASSLAIESHFKKWRHALDQKIELEME